jgi:hypothetical protein
MAPFSRQGRVTAVYGITAVPIGLAPLMPLAWGIGKLLL